MVAVLTDDPPYYIVRCDSGREEDTDASRVSALPGAAPTGAAAAFPSLAESMQDVQGLHAMMRQLMQAAGGMDEMAGPRVHQAGGIRVTVNEPGAPLSRTAVAALLGRRRLLVLRNMWLTSEGLAACSRV